jgi:hypothetical protein
VIPEANHGACPRVTDPMVYQGSWRSPEVGPIALHDLLVVQLRGNVGGLHTSGLKAHARALSCRDPPGAGPRVRIAAKRRRRSRLARRVKACAIR